MMRLCRWCGEEKPNNMFKSKNKDEPCPKIPKARKYRKPFGKCQKCANVEAGFRRQGLKPPAPIVGFITRPHQCEDCGTTNPDDFWNIRKDRCKACTHKYRYPKQKQWRQENRAHYNLMNNITQRKRRTIEAYQIRGRFIAEAARLTNRRPAQLTLKDMVSLFYLRLFKLTYVKKISRKTAREKIRGFEQSPEKTLYSLYEYKLPANPLKVKGVLRWQPM